MITFQTTDTITDKILLKEINDLKDRFCGFEFWDSRYSRTWAISDVVLADNGQIQMITVSGDKTQYTNEADLRFHGNAGQYLGNDISNLLNK